MGGIEDGLPIWMVSDVWKSLRFKAEWADEIQDFAAAKKPEEAAKVVFLSKSHVCFGFHYVDVGQS